VLKSTSEKREFLHSVSKTKPHVWGGRSWAWSRLRGELRLKNTDEAAGVAGGAVPIIGGPIGEDRRRLGKERRNKRDYKE